MHSAPFPFKHLLSYHPPQVPILISSYGIQGVFVFQSKFHGWNKKLSTQPPPGPNVVAWFCFFCWFSLPETKHSPWKSMVGRWISLGGPGLSSAAMLVFGECIGVVAISCSESVPWLRACNQEISHISQFRIRKTPNQMHPPCSPRKNIKYCS